MKRPIPARSLQSYRHEAYLWNDPADFTATMTAFVEDGVEAGEPVMVAVTAQHTEWMRERLSESAADQVTFVDMAQLGRNPARIIPAWRRFVSSEGESSRPVRGIGEPIWPGRHPEELAECQLHEALLNIAIEPDTPLWLICPYDTGALSPAVIQEAHRSHPVLIEAGSFRGSAHYAGRGHVDALFGAEPTTPAEQPREAQFSAATVHRLPAYLTLELFVAGLTADLAARLADAAHQLASGSLHRGAPHVWVRVWSDPDALICEVADDRTVADPLMGRRLLDDEHDGLWRVNQDCDCDLVQLRSTTAGTVVRILTWR